MKYKFKHRGHFGNLEKLLARRPEDIYTRELPKYGEMGVKALSEATPVDTGKTANSWSYTIENNGNGVIKLCFRNSNVINDWCPVAIILQYGHATRNGGWVEGRDYINPALRPVFDKIAKKAWEEVTGR